MDQPTWNTIEAILDEALALQEQEQVGYLKKACGNNERLYNEVEKLLRSIEESSETHFLENASVENRELVQNLTEDCSSSFGESFLGKTVGAFEITEQLGTGGMGSVFKGKRTDGTFDQQVAIKLLHQGLYSGNTKHRFRNERQILANLSHPNIARLYDGGLTKQGQPYFIMEYIDGLPIDRYCNKNKLSIDQRLKLFIAVCQAVEFSHSRLVIHRDLKAKNIFVTSKGQVKILDFGIAKLLNPSLSDEELIKTRPDQQFWTPYYGAPEQVLGKPVTTVSDVYSLGILLQQLLTDTFPYDFRGRSITEIRALVSEQSPKRLSKSLKQSSSLQRTARQRGLLTKELKKIAKGDLQAVVRKAIRRQPEERYNSVGQLMEDITNYQKYLPVRARRANLLYRLCKFMSRNKTIISVSTAAFILVLCHV